MRQITKIIIGENFNNILELTPNITHLKLNGEFDKPLHLTKHMLFLKCGFEFNRPIQLNKYMKSLSLGFCFNRVLKLTPDIRQLTLSVEFNQPIYLTRKIIFLYISYCFKQPIELSKNIKYLVVYDLSYNLQLFFPKHITHIHFSNYTGKCLLPKFLQTFDFEYNCANTYAFEYPIDKFVVWIKHFTRKYLPDDLPNCIKTVIVKSPWKNTTVHNKPSNADVSINTDNFVVHNYHDPEDFTKHVI